MDIKVTKHMASLLTKEIKTIKEQGMSPNIYMFAYNNPPPSQKPLKTILLSSCCFRNDYLPLRLPVLLPHLQYCNTWVTLLCLGTEKKGTQSSHTPEHNCFLMSMSSMAAVDTCEIGLSWGQKFNTIPTQLQLTDYFSLLYTGTFVLKLLWI